jgi:glutamate synthase domain-containing protein 3
MTGGRVVVLGSTGRNFAAGMCGGFAYVLDLEGDFAERVNPERVDLDPLGAEDEAILQRLVRRHFEYTRSARAEEVLRKWNTFAPKFVKVFPRDLKLALDARLAAHTGDG